MKDILYSFFSESEEQITLIIIMIFLVISILTIVCLMNKKKNQKLMLSFSFIILIVCLWVFVLNPDKVEEKGNKSITPHIEFLLVLSATLFTFAAFYVQFDFNKEQKEDIDRERIESRLFNYFQNLTIISNNIEVKGIGKNKKAFHFLFHQYKTLYIIFDSYIHEKYESQQIIYNSFKEKLHYCTMSFFFSGVTKHSNNQIRKRMMELYKNDSVLDMNILNEVFQSFENIVLNLQKINVDDLDILYRESSLVLFGSYASRVIDNKPNCQEIEWFWGYRTDLLPYVKYIIMIILYLNKEKHLSIQDKEDYHKNIFCQMSEHELGLLHIICNSPEIRILVGEKYLYSETGLITKITSIVKEWIENTNEMYNYEKWDDEYLLKKESKDLIVAYALNSPL